MTSNGPSEEPFGPGAVPTAPDDVAALRRHRPAAGSDWLSELTALANQFPAAGAALAQRRTFAGLEPFSLRAGDSEHPDRGRKEDSSP